ncbi:phospholipase SGR2-like [Fagus crenata]
MDSLEEGGEDSQEKEEISYGSLMIKRLTGSEEGRIDHMLQDKTFEHPYLQAIGSHTNYWRDYDTALFILKHLFRDTPEDPNSPKESSGGNSKEESGSTGWSDQREAVDEELPLTFSNTVMKVPILIIVSCCDGNASQSTLKRPALVTPYISGCQLLLKRFRAHSYEAGEAWDWWEIQGVVSIGSHR